MSALFVNSLECATRKSSIWWALIIFFPFQIWWFIPESFGHHLIMSGSILGCTDAWYYTHTKNHDDFGRVILSTFHNISCKYNRYICAYWIHCTTWPKFTIFFSCMHFYKIFFWVLKYITCELKLNNESLQNLIW